MATLEKRVQVLFSQEQYARLETAAAVEGMSIGALLREAADAWMEDKRTDARAALEELFDRADRHPIPAPSPEEWDAMKDEMWDRPWMRDAP